MKAIRTLLVFCASGWYFCGSYQLGAQVLDSTQYWVVPRKTVFPGILNYEDRRLEVILHRDQGVIRFDAEGKAIYTQKLAMKKPEYFGYRGGARFGKWYLGIHSNKAEIGVNDENGVYLKSIRLGVSDKNLIGPMFNVSVQPVRLEGDQFVLPMLWLNPDDLKAIPGKPTAIILSFEVGPDGLPELAEKPLQVAPEPGDELYNDNTDFMQGYLFAARRGGGFFEISSISPVIYEYDPTGSLVKRHSVTLPDSISSQYMANTNISIPEKQRWKVANETPTCIFFCKEGASENLLFQLSWIKDDSLSERNMSTEVCYSNKLIEISKNRVLVRYNPVTGTTAFHPVPAGMTCVGESKGELMYMRWDQDLSKPMVIYREQRPEWEK